MLKQDVLLVKPAAEESAEAALRAAIGKLNAEGKRVVCVTRDYEEYLLLYEGAAEEARAAKVPGIRANPDVITLAQGETAQVLVIFEGMPPTDLVYEMPEPGGGTVDREGVYTAPHKSGVFEIDVRAARHPDIRTRIYAAVK